MHPVAFRKAMIQAYMAGAEAMADRNSDIPSKQEARDWFDNEYGLLATEECDCCEENEDE